MVGQKGLFDQARVSLVPVDAVHEETQVRQVLLLEYALEALRVLVVLLLLELRRRVPDFAHDFVAGQLDDEDVLVVELGVGGCPLADLAELPGRVYEQVRQQRENVQTARGAPPGSADACG